MTSLTDTLASFSTLHFGEAQLGDVRRTRQLVQVADAIAQHLGGTLPQKIHDPTPLDALYHL
jgi:Transposase DNA-binding